MNEERCMECGELQYTTITDRMFDVGQFVFGTEGPRIFKRDGQFVVEKYCGFGEWNQLGHFPTILEAFDFLEARQDVSKSS